MAGDAERYKHLSAEERGVIMAMTVQGCPIRRIAETLGRSHSTVSRERRRNGYLPEAAHSTTGRPRIAGGYDAVRAGMRARRLRYKRRVMRKLSRSSMLWQQVWNLLKTGWSPQQIAGRLKLLNPDRPDLQVSHETIYTAIYAVPKGELRREITKLLRQHRGQRRPRSRGEERRGKFAELPSIHLRPPEVGERLLPGHWEGDLIHGARNQTAIGTLVDRNSLFVMLAKMEDTSARGALEGFSRTFAAVPLEVRQTLTYDRGKEMALYKILAERTGLSIYFADPHSPWQRGINENTNGLLRQYLPKSQNLAVHSQRELDAIAWSLNTRPRKTLGFRTPAEVFFEHCYQNNLSFPPGGALGT